MKKPNFSKETILTIVGGIGTVVAAVSKFKKEAIQKENETIAKEKYEEELFQKFSERLSKK